MSKQNKGECRSYSKSVRWEDKINLIEVMEMDNTVENSTSNGEAHFFTDFEVENEAETENQPPLSLVEDLFMNSTVIEMADRAEAAANNLRSNEAGEDDEDKEAALEELVTHLEDTAALLKQYMSPAPPNFDFVDNVSRSGKTNIFLKYQTIIVLFNQLLSILILSLFDNFSHDGSYVRLKHAMGALLQLLNMFLVVFASIVLSRQLLKSKVQSGFMAQTYISTVITFAGLYFMIFRFEPDSWEFGSIDKMDETIAIGQYVKMIYLSVSAATLCGAANIQPRTWYTVIILCFQSLINFVYFASILAQTIGNYNSYTVQVRRSNSVSAINRKKR